MDANTLIDANTNITNIFFLSDIQEKQVKIGKEIVRMRELPSVVIKKFRRKFTQVR